MCPGILARSAKPCARSRLGYDNFLGRLAVVRVYEGVLKAGADVFVSISRAPRAERVLKLFLSKVDRVEVQEAVAGDIVLVAGLPDIYIGETICAEEGAEPLPTIAVDEPTIGLNFLVNNSPFAGREESCDRPANTRSAGKRARNKRRA